MSERYQSLSALPTLADADEHARVTWDFDLPPTVDAERIQLHVTAIHAIQKVATFRATHVTSHQGETSQFTPSITGINANGTAHTTMHGSLSRAPKSDASLRDDYNSGSSSEGRHMGDYFKTTTINSLNRAEIASVVADGASGSRDRETRWAQALDEALSDSLRATARKHLMERISKPERVKGAVIYSMLGAATVDGFAQSDPAQMTSAVAVIYAFNPLIYSMLLKHETGKSHWRERRWSLAAFGGMQPDRYVAVAGITRAVPLVRARA